jgi:MYXO-CTERM domain-containing protein
VFGLATGGGGCGCRTAPRSGLPEAGAALFALLIGAVLRRRRQDTPELGAAAAKGGAR